MVETFGDPEGIGAVDETGFLKKGTHSVGVARQYTGTAGKRENSQVATVLSYATKNGHVFLDRALYLPEVWAADRTRRAQAHGRFYVLAVSANTRVWTERPEVEEPQQQTGGRPRLAPRVAQGGTLHAW